MTAADQSIGEQAVAHLVEHGADPHHENDAGKRHSRSSAKPTRRYPNSSNGRRTRRRRQTRERQYRFTGRLSPGQFEMDGTLEALLEGDK